jgi:hypothetical protein
VNNMPMQDYFVKDARSEGMDVLNNPGKSRAVRNSTVVPGSRWRYAQLADALSKPG